MKNALVTCTASYVRSLLSEHLPAAFVWHSLAHTEHVVDAATRIASPMALPPPQRERLLLAAWLHDTGYTHSDLHHEKESARIAEVFLRSQAYPMPAVREVQDLILATRPDQTPDTLLQNILRDADLAHLGSSDYFHWLGLLRQEWAQLSEPEGSDAEWLQSNIDFLKTHHWHTVEAETLFDRQKHHNISELQRRLSQAIDYESPRN